MAKEKYDDREDLNKLKTQWRKITAILNREKEWSAAIVRAATAAEIAANIAVRKRFEHDSEFLDDFVDGLMRWANGLDGKLTRLIVPSEQDEGRAEELRGLKAITKRLNEKRNAIVHRGAFANKSEAYEYVELARLISNVLVRPWEPDFQLKEKKMAKAQATKKRATN